MGDSENHGLLISGAKMRAGALSQSTVLSDATLLDSPLWTPEELSPATVSQGDCFGIANKDEQEAYLPGDKRLNALSSVASILSEHSSLCWITPRATGRYDQPAGYSFPASIIVIPDCCFDSRQSHSDDLFRSDSSSECGTSVTPTSRLRSGSFRPKGDNSLGYGPVGGWNKHVAPDGKPFFISHDVGVIFTTDTFIYRPQLLREIDAWKTVMKRIINAQRCSQDCPEKWEVYLRIDETRCYYYMIDHDRRLVFWVHEVEKCNLGLDDGVPECGIELFLETEFWAHLELFPHTLPCEAEAKLRGMLVYARIDSETAPGSTSPYTPEECSGFLQDLDSLSSFPTELAVVKTHFIARLLKSFSNNRSLAYYGEEGARVDRSQLSHTPRTQEVTTSAQIALLVLRFVVFDMDTSLLGKIEEVTVDDIVLPRLWKPFVASVVQAVKRSNTVTAIILITEVCVVATSLLCRFQSTAGFISIVLSFSSLLIGLHHERHHISLLNTSAYTGAEYFTKPFYPALGGYRLLAVSLCLPYAFLIWSILALCLAIGLLAYQTLASAIGWSIFLTIVSAHMIILAGTVWFFRRNSLETTREMNQGGVLSQITDVFLQHLQWLRRLTGNTYRQV